MVVLAAAVVTKTGKGERERRLLGKRRTRRSRLARMLGGPLTLSLFLSAALVSRQFVDMSRIRIEGLLAAFPKLVGTGKQHTYVETENVRYLYQPIEVRGKGDLRRAPPLKRGSCSSGKAGCMVVCACGFGLLFVRSQQRNRCLAACSRDLCQPTLSPGGQPPVPPGPHPRSVLTPHPALNPQSMYLVLVTNKSSNILEDLETLRLCGKVVPEYVEALEEEEVSPGWVLLTSCWAGSGASLCPALLYCRTRMNRA